MKEPENLSYITNKAEQEGLQEPTEEQEEWWEDSTPAVEIINSAYFALDAINSIDEMLGTNSDRQRKKRIQRKALRLLDHCIGELYDEVFGKEEGGGED